MSEWIDELRLARYIKLSKDFPTKNTLPHLHNLFRVQGALGKVSFSGLPPLSTFYGGLTESTAVLRAVSVCHLISHNVSGVALLLGIVGNTHLSGTA